MSEDWTCFKLIDFGNSKRGKTKSPKFINHCILPCYNWAPEFFTNKDFEPNIKTDIFALGTLLFILLFGKIPFNLATSNDHYYQHLYIGQNELFWKMTELNQKIGPIHPDIKKLLGNMIAKNPDDRTDLTELLKYLP